MKKSSQTLSVKLAKSLLAKLELAFERERPPMNFKYPVAKNNKISLPHTIIAELKSLLEFGNKVEAVKRVTLLTGAGLRLSKDYVDDLQQTLNK